ncbi:MAG: cytochrome c biogenesis protein CcsA [Burkholderiaceae bacterium]|nr:cytochrome c biogenesis protein CcsA [Burkholderiaceae bacterium]
MVSWRGAAPQAVVDAPPDAPARSNPLASWLQLAGLAVHAVSLYLSTAVEGQLHYGFAAILSAALWIGVALLWAEGLRGWVEPLRAVILPVAAVAVLLPMFFPGAPIDARGGPLLVPHIIVGTLSYAVLLLASLHAGLWAAADRALHDHRTGSRSVFSRFLDRLPPLLVLERILFRFITIGFVMLTLTAISGVFFSEAVFGRALRFDHKTVFTLISWFVFATLLVGRWRRGWRGRVALRLTFAGFAVLLLAYAGSRFVLEVLLHRY